MMPRLILFRRFEQNRPGSVSKQNTRRAVFGIHDRGHDVGADDQNLLVCARRDELGAGCEGVDEAGAGAGKVETPGVLCADLVLDKAGRGREEHVGCHRADDNEVQFRGVNATLFEQCLSGGSGKFARPDAFFDETALPNTGPLENPLIGCIESLLKILVCDAALRQVVANGGDFCTE